MQKDNDSGFENDNNNDNTAMLVIYCYRLQLFFYSQKLILSTILFCDVSVCMKCFCFAEGKWISQEWMQPLILSRFPLHKPASHSYWCSEASLHVTPARENGLSSPASWTWWTSQRGKSWRTLEDDWKADGWGRGPIPHGPLHRPPILIINHRPRFLIGLLGKPPPRPQRKRLFRTKF